MGWTNDIQGLTVLYSHSHDSIAKIISWLYFQFIKASTIFIIPRKSWSKWMVRVMSWCTILTIPLKLSIIYCNWKHESADKCRDKSDNPYVDQERQQDLLANPCWSRIRVAKPIPRSPKEPLSHHHSMPTNWNRKGWSQHFQSQGILGYEEWSERHDM